MNGWHWQDDALWNSCSAKARALADGWIADSAAQYKKLTELAARQPLVEIEATLQHSLQHAAELAALSQQLIVIGTGGASLGAQAFCALAEETTRVRFLENCDPVTLASFLRADGERTSWCIISKSGETVETLAAAVALIGHYGSELLRSRVRVITASPESALGRLAAQQHWTVLPHAPALGGRFSVFSLVGMLPAAFAGLPVEAILRRAAHCLQHLLEQNEPSLLEHAAWFAANMDEKPMQLLMAYADRLRAATQWYKQLWAESLGKDGKGGTPVTAIGAIDQHSQLQLYLDGPRDKLMTLWLPDMRGMGSPLPALPVAGLEFLNGHRFGDVMQATAEATATTMTAQGVPLRVLRGALTPETLAGWMARQMLETLLVAQLIGVDPYSQPAVETGKRQARAALAEA